MKFEVGQEFVFKDSNKKHIIKIIKIGYGVIYYKYIYSKIDIINHKKFKRKIEDFKNKILDITPEEFKITML